MLCSTQGLWLLLPGLLLKSSFMSLLSSGYNIWEMPDSGLETGWSWTKDLGRFENLGYLARLGLRYPNFLLTISFIHVHVRLLFGFGIL